VGNGGPYDDQMTTELPMFYRTHIPCMIVRCTVAGPLLERIFPSPTVWRANRGAEALLLQPAMISAAPQAYSNFVVRAPWD